MLGKLKTRLMVIGLIIGASGFSLWQNFQRTQGPDRPGQPINLGLDLQGGVHLALELDQSERRSADPSGDIAAALEVLRRRLDQLGVAERVIQKVGDHRIVVELPGVTDPARAKEIVRRSAFLEFRITDETGALERALPSIERAMREAGLTIGPERPPASSIDRLLANSGGTPPDSGAATTLGPLLEPGNMPGEYVVPEDAWRRVDSLLRHPAVAPRLPRNIDLRWAADSVMVTGRAFRYLYALEDRPIITGSSLEAAQAQVDPLTNGAEVTFELDRAGGRKFGQETGRHLGDYLAIVLDGRVQGRPPVIESRIERQGRIQMGGKSLQEAQDLALVLRAGALPTPLTIVEERQIGPTLGADSIDGGILAGITGTGLVVLMTVGYYAMSGVLAIAALLLYTLMTFGALAMFGATLTLPGLAGFVLSIGIAVDANVLIFERIREELGLGKPVRLAIDGGFRQAMPAIIDSNLTTVLTALFLFQFGTGPVQGFAVTLVIGIFASMITAVFVTRTLFLAWTKARPHATTLSIGRLSFFRNSAIDFIGKRRVAYAVTGLVLLVGFGLIATRGIESSVEFTGGTMVHFRTTSPIDEARLRDGFRTRGLQGFELQRFGGPQEFVVRVGHGGAAGESVEQTTTAVRNALADVVGGDRFAIERSAAISPKVSVELRTRAAIAILLSFLATLAYLAYRFEWRFGLAAVVATAHDILATIAFVAVMRLEVSLVVVAAVLTVVGYSLNDTIVIFDRVRENLKGGTRGDFVALLNRSVNETLPRTALTGGSALATLAALTVFGGEVIRPFALVMFFGIFTGTFSSIFIAAPILLAVERKWPGAKRSITSGSLAPRLPATEPG